MTTPTSTPRRKVLVTGARGRIASWALPTLREEFDLTLTDIAPPDGDPTYVQADLAGPLREDLCAGMDAIVHMAIASEPENRPPPQPGELGFFEENILRVNVQGTTHLFEAARRAGVKKIVFVSSMTVIWGDKHLPHYDHLTPLEPKNLYACSKIFGENLARFYFREHGISAICLRIGQPYPMACEVENAWRTSRRSRSIVVSMDDITRALGCALRTTQPFGIYNIVSGSDNQRVELSHAREIGYRPRDYFTEGELKHFPDGELPPPVLPVQCH